MWMMMSLSCLVNLGLEGLFEDSFGLKRILFFSCLMDDFVEGLFVLFFLGLFQCEKDSFEMDFQQKNPLSTQNNPQTILPRVRVSRVKLVIRIISSLFFYKSCICIFCLFPKKPCANLLRPPTRKKDYERSLVSDPWSQIIWD